MPTLFPYTTLFRSRAQRRLFAYGNTAIENPDVTRDIVARAGADFERIFGSE